MNNSNSVSVSIIVPVYNPPLDFFLKFIRSCLNQTLENIEIILINDASNEETFHLLNEIVQTNEKFRVIHRKKNGKAGIARQDGLAESNGEFILFADSDDVLDPKFCEVLYNQGIENNADIVICSWRVLSINEKFNKAIKLPEGLYNLEVIEEQIKAFSHLNNALWNKLFRKEIIGKIQFKLFPVNIGEDRIFNIEAFCSSRIIKTTSFIGYNYFLHENSATGKKSKGIDYLKVWKESESLVTEILENTGFVEISKANSEYQKLKTFIIGCQWISEEPNSLVRNEMWSYWKLFFEESVSKTQKGDFQLLLKFIKLITKHNSPSMIWKLCWPAIRLQSRGKKILIGL